MTPTKEQIEAELGRAIEQVEKGCSKFFGLTYEEGVDNTIRWMLGESDEAPMDE